MFYNTCSSPSSHSPPVTVAHSAAATTVSPINQLNVNLKNEYINKPVQSLIRRGSITRRNSKRSQSLEPPKYIKNRKNSEMVNRIEWTKITIKSTYPYNDVNENVNKNIENVNENINKNSIFYNKNYNIINNKKYLKWKIVRYWDNPATWSSPFYKDIYKYREGKMKGSSIMRTTPHADEWQLFCISTDPIERFNLIPLVNDKNKYPEIYKIFRIMVNQLESQRCLKRLNRLNRGRHSLSLTAG
eukprot:GHVL01000156.1.p1 GENE.GHVL01000156.1~~GHVL01000156.1.p1  ORF type:complete len:244 (-),score=65.62 GHVL01000156.1:104-835(-)